MAEPHSAVGALAGGVDTLTRLIARTLGPKTAPVLVAQGSGLPELLDDSATLARRVIGLSGGSEHPGVMLARSMCLQMHQRYGDGAATAAVLAQVMVARLARLVAAGGNPASLRRGVERGVAATCDALAASAVAPQSDELAWLATAATGDPDLGAVLGEVFDLLGEHAGLVIEERTAPGVDRAYIDGARWRARPAYHGVLPEGMTELTLADPIAVIADEVMSAGADILPALELAVAQRRPLLLVCREVADDARILLERNRSRLVVVSVCLASGSSRISADLDDLALLTGATLLGEAIGRPPRRLQPDSCGRARRALLHKDQLTVSGGAGDAALTSQRVAELTARSSTAEPSSDQLRALRLRIARLAGAMGVVVVGGYTEADRRLQADKVVKAQRVLESARTAGVVPGGGVAYLDCVQSVLAGRSQCADPHEMWGVEAVAAALAAPFCQIVRNHWTRTGGPDPALALEHVKEQGTGWGFDANVGAYALMAKAGVLDAAEVLRGAIQAAGSLAVTVATTAAVVRGRKPTPA